MKVEKSYLVRSGARWTMLYQGLIVRNQLLTIVWMLQDLHHVSGSPIGIIELSEPQAKEMIEKTNEFLTK